METNREVCFVIMPFSKTSEEHTQEYWTKHFESFLKPLIEANPSLEARRSEALRGNILTQIITDLVLSRVVVADLTELNPNVFWELGVRQSFEHGTITIAEEGTKLPFDISGKGTLWYDPKNHIKIEVFRKRFKEAIKDCLENPLIPDSHVLETLSGRGTLFEIFHRDETLRRLGALLSECNFNLGGMKAVLQIAQENKANPEKRYFPSTRFRSSAVELLITNAYIDENRAFFESAEKYFVNIIRLYEQSNLWQHYPDATEKYILKHVESFIRGCEKFKREVEEIRDKMRKRI
jgi:hypothetical protein